MVDNSHEEFVIEYMRLLNTVRGLYPHRNENVILEDLGVNLHVIDTTAGKIVLSRVRELNQYSKDELRLVIELN